MTQRQDLQRRWKAEYFGRTPKESTEYQCPILGACSRMFSGTGSASIYYSKTLTTSSSSFIPQSSSKPALTTSRSTSQASGSKPGKPKEVPKQQSTKPDLTGKLDSHSKLTQQERQCQIDNDLCMFCGKKGHKLNDCILRQNAVKAQASSTTASTCTSSTTPAQGEDSVSESKKQ